MLKCPFESDILTCTHCPLYTDGNRVPGEFVSTDVVIIGRSPGRNENSSGRPFVGMSGKKLRDDLAWLGPFSIMNVVKCFIKNGVAPTSFECKICGDKWIWPELEFVFRGHSHTRIIMVGMEALQYFFPGESISKRSGCEILIEVNGITGYEDLFKEHRTRFFGLIHPAAVLRDSSKYGKYSESLANLSKIM